MLLDNRACSLLWDLIQLRKPVHPFFNLPVHALFNHNVAELILAELTELVRRGINLNVTFAHVVHLLAALLSLTPPLLLLLEPSGIQMLVSLQESVLDPEHQ